MRRHGSDDEDAAGASLLQLAWHATTTAALLLAPGFALADALRGRGLAPMAERLGRAPRMTSRPIWLHAASVGEVAVAAPLAGGLASIAPLLLSTTTATGRGAVPASLRAHLAAHPFHLPVDAAPCVSRALGRAAPRAFLALETELWPNLLAACHRRGIAVAIVNARLSDVSLNRYARVRPLVRRALLDVDLVLARTSEDAARFEELGAPSARLRTTGNVKFDAARDAARSPPPDWVADAGLDSGRWLAFASTAEGEEGALLDAFESLRPKEAGLRLLLAPRRPERFDEVASLVARRGLPLVRRSAMPREKQAVPVGGVLLLDSLGELARLYRYAELAFVGGSLVPRGGQNLLEPAAGGCPVLFGPDVANFRDAEQALLEAGGGMRVTESTLAATVASLVADAPRRRAMSIAALGAVNAHAGATSRTLEALRPILEAPA